MHLGFDKSMFLAFQVSEYIRLFGGSESHAAPKIGGSDAMIYCRIKFINIWLKFSMSKNLLDVTKTM